MSVKYYRSFKDRKSFKKLSEKERKNYIKELAKFDALIMDLDTERLGKFKTSVTVFVIFWHQIVIAIVIFLLLDRPYLAIMAFNLNSLYFITYIGWVQPYRNKLNYFIVMFDVCVLLVVQYHIFGFTNWTTIEQQQLLGNSIIYVIMAYFTMRVLMIIFVVF